MPFYAIHATEYWKMNKKCQIDFHFLLIKIHLEYNTQIHKVDSKYKELKYTKKEWIQKRTSGISTCCDFHETNQLFIYGCQKKNASHSNQSGSIFMMFSLHLQQSKKKNYFCNLFPHAVCILKWWWLWRRWSCCVWESG